MKKIKILGSILLFLVLIPVASFSVSLDEAIDMAIKNSEAMKIVISQSDSIKGEADKQISIIKPQLKAEGGYLVLDTNKENPLKKINPTYASMLPPEFFSLFEAPDKEIWASASLSQVVFAGGRIWRSIQLKKNLYEQADILVRSSKKEIKALVKLSYYGVLLQKALVEVMKDRFEQRKEELKDAESLRDVGMGTALDVRQAQLALNISTDTLTDGEAKYQEALINFNLALGRSGKDPILNPDGKLERSPTLPENIKKFEEYLNNDTLIDIQALKKEVNSANLQYKIAKGEMFPTVGLIGSIKTSGDETSDMSESWAIGAQLTWDIYNGGLIGAKKAVAISQKKKANDSLIKKRKEYEGLLENLKIQAQSLEKRIKIQEETVVLAKENYNDGREFYRAGTITQTRLSEFNLYYSEARFSLLGVYFKELELLTKIQALIEN
ncbi:MAG: TolC family protein [Desulfobacterales bacterium]|nr:TolC family protein [Desulfobacterales bacterium]